MLSNINATNILQQQASNPDNSVWVFASAGSGKTRVLSNRVLRLLLNDILPNKILCLTFTKAAANEMQDRINKELAYWVSCDNDDLIRNLTNLSGKNPSQNEINKARILFNKILDDEFKIKVQTIHGFCANLLKIFPFEAKINPNFELIEDFAEDLLLQQAKENIFKQAFLDNELRNLIIKTSAKIDEDSLDKVLSNLLNKKEKISNLKDEFFTIENITDEIFKKFSFKKNVKEEEIFQEFLQKINYQNLTKILLDLEKTKSSKNIESLNKIKNFLQHKSLDNFYDFSLAFLTKENEARKFYGKIETQDLIDEQRNLIINFKELLNSLKICNDSILLIKLLNKILENYNKIKKDNSYLDYNDLIINTNQLLENPDFSNWVKLKMDGSFDHILIDESQDTNHQQWNIIKALTEDFFSGISANNQNRSIFIVGDEKQSIYSFQGANPNISQEIFEYFKNRLGNNFQKIELNNSFRSLPKILESVDRVFANPIYKNAISKLNEFKNHSSIRSGVGKVEIWPQIFNEKKEKNNIDSFEWKTDFSYDLQESGAKKLAKLIALRIKDLTKENQVKYSDIMILLKSRVGEFNSSLIDFFHEYQIPFFSKKEIKFSDNLLLQDLLLALKFSLLPIDDLNLASLLKSPIFNISEEDLLEICQFKNEHKTSIYKALQALEKFVNIKNELDELIKESKNLDLYGFFDFLINQKNNHQKLVEYFGSEALEILDKFLILIFDFNYKFSPSKQKFLSVCQKLDLTISLNGNKENAVSLSTIHGAKGLQAKIVFIPDCAYDFNKLPNAKENIFWLDGFPIWCAKKELENNLVKQLRFEKNTLAQEEFLRLLYVAMTRAEDELYIAGFGNSQDPKSWYEIIKQALPENLVELPEIKIESKPSKHQANQQVVNVTDKKPKFTAIKANDLNELRTQGKVIHKILEIFGKNHQKNKAWLEGLVKKIVLQEKFLNEIQKEEIIKQTSNFLYSPLFKEIFIDEIKCEFDICYKNSIMRIDLIRISQNEILIIDYKSDEILPQKIPENYASQISSYKEAISQIFPQKTVKTAILWTKFLQLSFL